MKPMMTLPIDGRTYACQLQGDEVIARAIMPGTEDASHFPCADNELVATLDSNRKRSGLFEFVDGPPWIRKVLPFATLPKGCVGHTALALEGGMLVGGHSDSGEALWWRHPDAPSDDWQVLELPREIRRRGKAIDGLHRSGARVIAVDDIVVPKWLLLYSVTNGPGLVLDEMLPLPHHTTYEQIFSTYLGRRLLWCASRGINHGRVSTHIWGVEPPSFREAACWSIPHRESPIYATWDEAEAEAPRPLESTTSVFEWGDGLLVACGQQGLVRLLTRPGDESDRTPNVRPVPGLTLAYVTGVQPHPVDPARGVFAVGRQPDGKLSHQWIPAARLNP